jgi:hypothetical protein
LVDPVELAMMKSLKNAFFFQKFVVIINLSLSSTKPRQATDQKHNKKNHCVAHAWQLILSKQAFAK